VDVDDSPEEATFRAAARAWLAAHAEPAPTDDAVDAVDADGADGPGGDPEPTDLAEHVARCRRWQAVLHEHGWAGITWPVAFGGRGGSPTEAAIFAEEQARFAVSTGVFSVAIGMVGPTLIAHGSPGQRERFLGPMLRGEHLWCQLFSEPGAGSDLASLGARAVPDGDGWRVTGQKVWTSLAQFSDFGILLARTDPDAPKHQGITCFVVDMATPGIEIRPLRQMTGISHFNEVFLTDVAVPADGVIGAPGEGWKVAQTTLASERALIGGAARTWTVDELIDLARRRGATDDPVVRQRLAEAVARAATLRYQGYRLRTAASQRRAPGREALVMKLGHARHWVATTATAMDLLGPAGTVAGGDATEWEHHFLNQYAIRLGGGTDEVQANIIAERGLGLPREPGDDRQRPWKELARS